jgi:hypothetical protein
MDDPAYVINNFDSLLEFAQCEKKNLHDKSFLELGPGDSVGSGVLAYHLGMDSTLVDVEDFATQNLEFYMHLGSKLGGNAIDLVSETEFESFDDFLNSHRINYLTNGLRSLKKLKNSMIDIVISQACLEHIKKSEFQDIQNELFRVCRNGAQIVHHIDFKDHLSYGLNNLRFSDEYWEKPLVAKSGFYTNRLRYSEMINCFLEAGFFYRKRKKI